MNKGVYLCSLRVAGRRLKKKEFRKICATVLQKDAVTIVYRSDGEKARTVTRRMIEGRQTKCHT